MILPIFALGAAGAAPAKTGLAALPTPDGALLRWALPGDTFPARGFVVRVTDGTAPRTLKVASPGPAPTGLTPDVYKTLVTIYSKGPVTDDDRLQRAFMNLNVAVDARYARALGILTTVTGLTPGPHTATVLAVSATGQETRVGQASFSTQPTPAVPAPTALKVSASGGVARLHWEPPAAGSFVVAYNVYRAGPDGKFTLLKPAPFFRSSGNGETFEDRTLGSASVQYRVGSVDLFGRESAPTAPVVLSLQPSAQPISPELTRVTSTGRQVELSWAAPRDPRVRAVLVLRGTDPGTPLTVLRRVPVTVTRWTDDQVVPGTPYVYALAAEDTSGQVSGRGPLTAVTPVNPVPPAAPTSVTVVPTTTALTLSWAASREPDLLGYQVYRTDSPAGGHPLLLNSQPLKTTTFTDAIPAGVQTRYFYRIVAVNTSQVASAPSTEVTATLVDRTPPPAPSFLPVAARPGGVWLTWVQAPVPDLAGFEMSRAAAGEAPLVIARPSADARSYSDTAAVPGTVYAYTLASVDGAGNRSAPSLPVQTARPAGPVPVPAAPTAKLLPGGAGAALSWQTDTGLQVVVYRMEGDVPVQLTAPLSTSPYMDAQGTETARYQLRAVRGDGQVSDLTAVFPVTGP